MPIHSRSTVQNYINWWFWIRKNKNIYSIKEQHFRDVIDKIYLYARYLNEPKYPFLIKKRKNARIKHYNDPNAFIECSNTMDDVYEDIDKYNPKADKKKS